MERVKKVVFVLGDVHAEFPMLNTFIDQQIRHNEELRSLAGKCRSKGVRLEVLMLQCGDFGYFWPHCDSSGMIKNEVDFLDSGLVPIYWCAGNHEDHDRLDLLFSGPASETTNMIEVDKGVIFCRFGATLNLAPDIRILFAGGAESIDKHIRLKEMENGAPRIWWPQEGIEAADLARLDKVRQADWVISHTAPRVFGLEARLWGVSWELMGKCLEPSREQLDRVWEKFKPKRWFFGHFHLAQSGQQAGCQWEGLSFLGDQGKHWSKMEIDIPEVSDPCLAR